MTDWVGVAVRFALYADLLLLCGLPLFVLSSFRDEWRRGEATLRFGPVLMVAAIGGLALSILSLALLARSMSGIDHIMDLDQHVFTMVIGGTNAGTASALRIVALILACAATALMIHRSIVGLWVLTVLALLALATLAWGGHGGMNEGIRGLVHLGADIVHLVAAAAWIGALAAFVWMLFSCKVANLRQVSLLRKGLKGFAATGTIIVIVLATTGVLNYWLITGPTVDGLISTPYGVLLLIKLALFVLMLSLATANRFHLSPRLERSIALGDNRAAVAALRKSLVVETGAAVAILGLVSWLGTLSPPGSQ